MVIRPDFTGWLHLLSSFTTSSSAPWLSYWLSRAILRRAEFGFLTDLLETRAYYNFMGILRQYSITG